MAETHETLEHLATLTAHVCGASTVAVWASAMGRIELRYSAGLAQQLYNRAHIAWRDLRTDLQDGRTVFERGISFVPLLSGRHDLVGMLAIPRAVPEEHPQLAYFNSMLRRIARYVQQPTPPPLPDVLVVPLEAVERPGGLDELLRDVLAALLIRHGWNVSLVASLLGVSRTTLLARLRRLGVERPRPSTKARPPRPSSDAAGDMLAAARNLLWPRVEAPALSGGRPKGKRG